MTALGKILVFVNLAFSLLVGGLIVTVFLTRTNWKNGYDDLARRLQVASAALAAEKELATSIADSKDRVIQKKDEAIADLDTRLKSAQEATAALQMKFDQTVAAHEKELLNTQSATLEMERRREEIKQLTAQRVERDAKILLLQKDVVAFRDKAVQNEISFKSAEERNRNLLAQIEQMSKQINQLKATGARVGEATVSAAPVAPSVPADVRGTVKAADKSSGLATISVGSDAGVSKDSVLQVYRLKPNPTYLGTLKILATRPHESVGRFDPAKRVSIEPGDEVASRVLTTQ